MDKAFYVPFNTTSHPRVARLLTLACEGRVSVDRLSYRPAC